MANRKLLIWGMVLAVTGFLGLILLGLYGLRAPFPDGGLTPMQRTWQNQIPSEFTSNGQRIYFTAISDSGQPITFAGGPVWLRMHGGSCAACHGPDGRGGIQVMMTDTVSSDIRYSALANAEDHEHAEEEHPPYDDTLVKRAITKGIDPSGKPLHPAMPRWNMSEEDLSDLVRYLHEL